MIDQIIECFESIGLEPDETYLEEIAAWLREPVEECENCLGLSCLECGGQGYREIE